MRNAVSDVQAMSDTAISTTDSLVTKDSILLLLNVVPTTDSILLLPSSVPVGSQVPVELRLALNLEITTHPHPPPLGWFIKTKMWNLN